MGMSDNIFMKQITCEDGSTAEDLLVARSSALLRRDDERAIPPTELEDPPARLQKEMAIYDMITKHAVVLNYLPDTDFPITIANIFIPHLQANVIFIQKGNVFSAVLSK